MLGKEVDNMDSNLLIEQFLNALSENNYNIDQILEMIPEHQLEELKIRLKEKIKNDESVNINKRNNKR